MTVQKRRRRFLAGPQFLEDRSVPAVFNALVDPTDFPLDAIDEIIGFLQDANTNAEDVDVINLFADSTYVFNYALDLRDGGTALPVLDDINDDITINGNNSTFLRPPGAESFRFLRSIGYVDPDVPIIAPAQATGPTLRLNDLTLSGANVFDYTYPNRIDPDFPVLDGGAVRLDNADLITNNVTFFHNTSADNGGAVALNARYGFSGRSQFNDTVFEDNFAGKLGGAVSALQPDRAPTIFTVFTFTDSTLEANVSLTGAGAAHGDPVFFEFERSIVRENRGEVGGVSASIVHLQQSLFQENVATGDGPAAVIATGNMLRIYNSTITGNTSSSAGAVVGQGQGRAVEVLNSTIHDNFGGSAAVSAPIGEVVVTFSTITNNRAGSGDVAGVEVPANFLTTYGSVIAGNRVTNASSPNADIKTNQVRNDGYNLIGIAPTSFPAGPTDLVGFVGVELDPMLSELGDYGGIPGITLTRLPTAGSPLLNAGGVPLAARLTTDERGLPRVVGGAADIGAAELQAGDPSLAAEPPPSFSPPPPPAITATFNATIDPQVNNAAAVNEIIGFFAAANSNNAQIDIINLWTGGTYTFNAAFEDFDGGTALPVIDTINETLTVNGGAEGATFFRPPGAPSFRFLRAVGGTNAGPTLNINDIDFTGGNVFDMRAPDRITGEFAKLHGGAIRIDSATLNATDVGFFQNTATDNGGAVAFHGLSFSNTQTFTNAVFEDNYAGLLGGAVSNSPDGTILYSTLRFTDSTLDGNVSLTGAGAIEGLAGVVDLVRTKITGNRGEVGGVSAGIITATSSLFQFNAASGAGPAAVIATGNQLILTNSTVTQNSSVTGGAIVGQGQGRAVELLNSTVHNNTGGSAAVSAPIGQVVLSFATVTNNRATSGDVAGVESTVNIIDVYASVVAGNRVADPASPNVDLKAAQIRNNRFNLIGVAPSTYPTFSGDLFGTAGTELNPLLSVLGDYGGVAGITLTRLPTAGSPLLNAAGTPLATRITTDERGVARISGTFADIGAAEFRSGVDPALPAQAPLPPLIPPPPPPPPPPPGPAPVPSVAVVPGAPKNFGATTPPTVITVQGTTVATTIIPPNEARIMRTDGTVKLSVTPFGGSVPGGLRVASADVNGDNAPDLIVATGPGALGTVAVFDGATGAKITSFVPFEGFTGGLFVTAGDLSGDGRADIVISADMGGGPRITAYRTTDYVPFVNFFGIADSGFRGGARAAVGDLNNDGVNDLVVTAGPGGGPRVSIFDGTSLSNGEYTARLVNDFFVYDPGLRDGVYVAVGDVNLDGFAELFVAAAAGGGPRVSVFSGSSLTQNGLLTPLANFFSGDPARRDGVPIAVQDLDGDGRADLIAGGGATGTVRTYYGATIATGTPASEFDAFAGYLGGVFVG